jgi:hypothetical protein
MKYIKVFKVLGNSRHNIHYINVDHIIEFYEWNGNIMFHLSNNEKMECANKIEEIEEILLKLRK